ncbi:phage tail tape measure protein [Lonepinella sp. BR2919]|uniref:phage tail tape measure protein n=1 Tax=unclassified Lonepinella TaxID=2642006 RepID=UPI003F6E32BD
MSQNLQLNVILSAVDKLTAPFRNASKQAEKLSAVLKNAKTELKGLEKSQNTVNSFKNTRESFKKTIQTLETHKQKLVALRSTKEENKTKRSEIAQDLSQEKIRYSKLLDAQWSAKNYGKGDLSKINAEVMQYQTRLQALGKRYDELSGKIAKTTQQMRNEKQAISASNRVKQNQYAQLKQLRTKLREAGISTKELAKYEGDLKTKIDVANNAIEKQQQALKKVNERVKQRQAYRNQVETLKSGSQRLQNFGQRSMMTGTATLGAGYIMMRPAFDFEQDFAKVEALTGLNRFDPKQAEQLERLRQQGIDLGANTSFTSGEVAQGQGYLAMAGFGADQIEAAMPAVLNMTKAAGIEMGRASDIASDISSGFKISADDMGRVADVLVNTFSSSNTTLEGLGETMKYLGPIATSTGQDFETMSAMVGLLGNVGIKGTQAGTSLRSAMLRLAAPPKQAAQALGKLGVRAKDKKGNMRSLTDILVDVEKATKKMGSGDRMEYYKKIFGTEAATAMVELVGQAGIDGIQQMTEKLKNSAGRAEEIAKVMSDNFWGDVKTLSSAKDAISISIFKEVAPFLRETVQKFTDVLRKINDWIKANPQLTASIIKWTASGAGLMAVLGGISMLTSYLLYPIARAALGFYHFSGMSKLLSFALKDNDGKFRKINKSLFSFKTTFNAIPSAGKGFINTLKKLPSTLMGSMGKLKNLSTWLNGLKNMAKLIALPFRLILSPFKLLFTTIGMLFSPVGLVVAALVTAALTIYKYWDQVKAFFGGFWTGLKQGLAPVIEKFQPLATIFGTIVGWIVDLVKWFINLFTPIQSTKEGLEGATKAGESFGQGLAAAIDFVTKPLQWLMDSVKWLGENLSKVFDSEQVNKIADMGNNMDDPNYDPSAEQAKKTEALKKANKTISLPPQRQQQTKYVQEMYEYATFATGGYTGNGGKYQPAGIVHAGEYVMTKQATSKLGVPLLNALNYGKNALIGTGLGLSVAMAQPIQIDDRPPLKATMSQMVTQQPMQVSITVNANAGQDPQAIAREVARQLQQLQSQQQAQQRSSLRDRD